MVDGLKDLKIEVKVDPDKKWMYMAGGVVATMLICMGGAYCLGRRK